MSEAKVFWLSWYDPPNGKPGRAVSGIKVWITGLRIADDAETVCARVEADSESEAWHKADVCYPGAATAERRFSEEHAADWWPPNDRFPRGPATRSADTKEGR